MLTCLYLSFASMETLPAFWQLDYSLLTLGSYNLSLIEVLAVVFSLLSTYLLRQHNRLGWVLAVLGNLCFFCFFYQIRLYGLMAAQVILCCFNLAWGLKAPLAQGLPIKKLDSLGWPFSIVAIIAPGMPLLIVLFKISQFLPDLFPLPATYVLPDALSSTGSIVALVLMRRRFLESWIFWMVIHSLLILVFAWKGYYVAMLGQMGLLGYAANEYMEWRSLDKHK